jgi:hypothetical protein
MGETLVEFLGTELTADWFELFVEKLGDALEVRAPTVFDSVRSLAGVVLTRPLAYALAWRLAGNLDVLREDIPVPPWFTQDVEEWLPVQVLSWQPEKSARGKPMNGYRVRVLAGSACPLQTTASWPAGFTKMIARQIGFTARRGKMPFQHPSELVQLRLRVLADPVRSKPGQLGFWEVAGGAGLTNWNKEILKMRARIDFACPENYTHPCYRCAAGWDICPAATHKDSIYDDRAAEGNPPGEASRELRGITIRENK